VVFVGGTGTGKSTLFNVLCGAAISAAGMERPTTAAPVVYVHATHSLDTAFPFSNPVSGEESALSHASTAGKEMIVFEHDRNEIDHLVMVDTPDLDSIDRENRRMAEDLYRLADLIIFVTSQEKYADEIPSRTLGRVKNEGVPYFFLFNKADPAATRDEVIDFFRNRGLAPDGDRYGFIPYTPALLFRRLSGRRPSAVSRRTSLRPCAKRPSLIFWTNGDTADAPD
jgi:GTPase Era involved in 16S rRNA processing